MQSGLPATRDLVLIGGGHTHVLVLRKWGMQPLAGARVTLINPGPTAPYSGMLPGFVAGHYSRDDLDIDLVRLARFAGARLIVGPATAIDRAARVITVPGFPPIAYDVAALDIGITSDMPALPGFAAHAIPAKPLGPFATRWETYRQTARDPHVAVIGGGVAGAELAMAMAHALRTDGHRPTVHLIDRGRALDALNQRARTRMMAALSAQGITVAENASVREVTDTGVALDDGRVLRADFTTGAAGARAHDWLSQTGLALHDGFVAVGAALQSSDPAIFAAGDCAHMTDDPRPKAGVFAVRQANILFDNLRATLADMPLRPFRPQRDYLKLISLGGKSALAERFGTAISGPLMWRWKDRIDRRFMDRFRDLPTMSHPDIPLTAAAGLAEALGEKPMCGGCGAKVGRGALRAVLADRRPVQREDITYLPGDDAAVLQTGTARQVISTDHLRAFCDDPVTMARIAAVHALGDIWAMGADPQAAVATIILPRLSTDLQRRTLAEIMTAAATVVEDAGAAIVGGHTSVGTELTIGFTITGICPRAPITLGGAHPGDALILTKPLGSGVILAADMALQARGADVIAAHALMQQGQAAAAKILAPAHAMTDVTGFGLAGHLAGICEASQCAATLTLSAVPVMQGAVELAQQGVRSTIWADNRSSAGAVIGAAGPIGDLLFDPQTAGGLLAAVPQASAADLVTALQHAGYAQACVIGQLSGDAPQIRVLT